MNVETSGVKFEKKWNRISAHFLHKNSAAECLRQARNKEKRHSAHRAADNAMRAIWTAIIRLAHNRDKQETSARNECHGWKILAEEMNAS